MLKKLRCFLGRRPTATAALPSLLVALYWSGIPPGKALLVKQASGFDSPISFGFDDQIAGNTFTAGPLPVGATTGEMIIFTSSNKANEGNKDDEDEGEKDKDKEKQKDKDKDKDKDENEDKDKDKDENKDQAEAEVIVNGGAVISAPAPLSPNQEYRHYGLATNGVWEDLFSWAGVNSELDYIEFRFDSGMVSAAGAFMNYAPGFGTPQIAAYDNQGQLLASYNLEIDAPISTPDQINGGEFRGILWPTLDIRSLRLIGAYAVASTISFSRALPAVPSQPVPGPLPLLGLAAAMGWASRMRRRLRRRPGADPSQGQPP